MSKTYKLKPFQQAAFDELCQLAIAFHDSQPLEDMQKELWEMLKAALTPAETNYDDVFITSNMLYLYERIKAAITAVYGLARNPYEDKPTKKKSKKKKAS